MRTTVFAVLAILAAIICISCNTAHPPIGEWVAENSLFKGADTQIRLSIRDGGFGVLMGQSVEWSVTGDRLTITDESGLIRQLCRFGGSAPKDAAELAYDPSAGTITWIWLSERGQEIDRWIFVREKGLGRNRR